jgi:hypothetical protein
VLTDESDRAPAIVIERYVMIKIFDPTATAISAIENASRIPVTKADLKRMLVTGTGEPSHVMALFSDVGLSTLMRLAIAFEISDEVLARGYVHARDAYAVSNPEMDELAAEMGIGALPSDGHASP